MVTGNEITSMRIPKSVKAELKKMALEREPMHVTIQRLIKENLELKKMNDLLQTNIELMKR